MISSLSTFYPSNSSPFDVHVNQGQKSLYSIWNGHPTFNRESLQWVYKPLRTWVDEFIPYHMEIMGVDRPETAHVVNIIFVRLRRRQASSTKALEAWKNQSGPLHRFQRLRSHHQRTSGLGAPVFVGSWEFQNPYFPHSLKERIRVFFSLAKLNWKCMEMSFYSRFGACFFFCILSRKRQIFLSDIGSTKSSHQHDSLHMKRCRDHWRMGVSFNGGTPISHPKMIIF